MKIKFSFLKPFLQPNFKNIRSFSTDDHHHFNLELDKNKVYVYMDKKFQNNGIFNLIGLNQHSIKSHLQQYTCEDYGIKNLKNHNPFNVILRPSKLSNVVDEENNYIHEDSYGYTIFDDVINFFLF